jgi:hypothetical protein
MVQRRIVTLIASTALIALSAGCATQSTSTGLSLSAPAASPPIIASPLSPTWRGWYPLSTNRFQAP